MTTAMVWGAAGGIGRAVARRLLGEGWEVIMLARDGHALGDLADDVIEVDVTRALDVAEAMMLAGQRVDQVDLMVYAAGDIASSRVDAMSSETWIRIVDANLTGAYLAVHYSLPLLAPDAHIVLLGAVSERLRLPGLSSYAAAKAGLEAFADVLRKEERTRRVTVVRPAAVETALWDKVPLKLPAHAASPLDVAEKILMAYQEGHPGMLDLT